MIGAKLFSSLFSNASLLGTPRPLRVVYVSCFLVLVFLGSSSLLLTPMAEICDNGIDDDNDGLIDLNDTDCDCIVVEPISLIPNPSFEDLNCCPFERSQLNCADVWIQASEPTTDLINVCDWLGWDEFPPPMPFPDGGSIMGFRDGRVRRGNGETNWKEYAGACLINPLEADSTYRFQFDLGFVNSQRSPPINVSFFGTTDCSNLPFGVGNEDFGCPINGPGWIRLGSKLVSGGSSGGWVNTILEVTPEVDITAIAIGPDCPGVVSPVSLYYFFDNLLLADINSFDFGIRELEHPCQPDFSLSVPFNSGVDYQWYKDGIALIDENDAELSQVYGEGDYQVRIDNGIDCRISVKYTHQLPVITSPVSITICEESFYEFGDRSLRTPGNYVDTFKSVNNCDSIVFLELKVLGTLADSVQAQIFEGETYRFNDQNFRREGEHLLTLESSLGCDSLVLLLLDYYDVYIPNTFSPNSDGINDRFSIYSARGLISNIDLTIYDRWGGKVATGPEWDGRENGSPVDPGVFIYVAKIQMSDGIERQFSGAVTVIK